MREQYPCSITREQFEEIRPLFRKRTEKDNAEESRPIWNILCHTVPAQKRLPMAYAAGSFSQMEYRLLIILAHGTNRRMRAQASYTGA